MRSSRTLFLAPMLLIGPAIIYGEQTPGSVESRARGRIPHQSDTDEGQALVRKDQLSVIDSIPVLSVDAALALEDKIKDAYAKLSPSVVRLWPQNDDAATIHEPGDRSCSGVIIERTGLILTCSHHGNDPGTRATIELADGRRVAGEFLGRFQLNDPRPLHVGPDLGFAKFAEPGDWPSTKVHFGKLPAAGQTCLAIGYPGTLLPGRPPLLRIGRITPSPSQDLCVETTTALAPGDSGGPLFDLAGRVVGIATGGDNVAPTRYQSLAVLEECLERLKSGEVVSAATKVSREVRGRPAQPAAFAPLPDLETRVLQMQRSIIRVMDGPHAIAAGLIIDADGLAITKGSLVGSRREWSCRLFHVVDKAIVKGRVIATSAEHDLALMKVDVRDWPAVAWSEHRPAVGMVVSSPLGRTAGPLRFAVVGAATEEEPVKPNDIPQIPLSVEPGESGEPV